VSSFCTELTLLMFTLYQDWHLAPVQLCANVELPTTVAVQIEGNLKVKYRYKHLWAK
jgi:hypothetical protein